MAKDTSNSTPGQVYISKPFSRLEFLLSSSPKTFFRTLVICRRSEDRACPKCLLLSQADRASWRTLCFPQKIYAQIICCHLR